MGLDGLLEPGVTDLKIEVAARELYVLAAGVASTQSSAVPVSVRLTTAGDPAAKLSGGIVASAATTEPAATSERRPTRAPLRTTALLPISAPSSIVQSSIVTLWPIVQSSPIVVRLPRLTWTTELSWMLVRAPIRIGPLSARITTPNQMLDSSPTSTSPIKTAVGATKADGCDLRSLAVKLDEHPERLHRTDAARHHI